ncbi:AraC family transcriptional regulator [Paenibacillus koleovorans]|uniref:AraC family transcriptional regulator n=1 Tax=Paenibacillus koleovorans TaxID=121608 RepID=UPI000FD92882|nr:helix-turn-helix domain-containing protein [Paenibacillus koleovorans]
MLEVLNTFLDDYIPDWHNRKEHIHSHVLVLVTEGTLKYQLNDQELTATKGDLLFIPRGTRREAKNDSGTLHQKYAVTFQANGPTELPMLRDGKPRRIRTRSFDYFKEKFMLLHRQTLEKRSYYETIRQGLLLELLGLACRELETAPISHRKQQLASKLEQHIISRYREAISLQELAGLIDRSPNYTLTLFKEVVGQTPLEYQHRLRITTAMELLRNTRFTVAFIADHLGYYDPSYFYKMFRKYTGQSPSTYMG